MKHSSKSLSHLKEMNEKAGSNHRNLFHTAAIWNLFFPVFSGIVFLILNCPASAQISLKNKIVASVRWVDDNFGRSVSISGTYAIAGAAREDEDAAGGNNAMDAGAAYIFEYDGSNWVQKQKIVASDRAVLDGFGGSVSISGNYAVGGATGEDHDVAGANPVSNAGSAYIFERVAGTWAEAKKIVAPDRVINDYFGSSVSISGDYAIVSAPSQDYATIDPTSPLWAGTAVNDASGGTVAWGFPNLAAGSNAADYAVTGSISGGAISNYLVASNFGFAIPAGMTITGVEANVEWKASSVDPTDNKIYLVKGGTIQTGTKNPPTLPSA